MSKKNELESQITNVQINYLKATNPELTKAIRNPLTYNNLDKFSENQIKAFEYTASEILTVIIRIIKLTENLNEEEANLCLIVAAILVETADDEKEQEILNTFLPKELQQKKLFPIINRLKVLLADLEKRDANINLDEYYAICNGRSNRRFEKIVYSIYNSQQ